MQNDIRGALYIILACLFQVVMGCVEKLMVGRLPAIEVMLLRYGSSLFFFLGYWVFIGQPSLKTRILSYHFLRAIVGLLGVFCLFVGFKSLKLSTALLLKQVSPLLSPFIALIWLKEKLPKWCLVSLTLGLVGVIFVVKPTSDFFQPASLVVILGAAFFAVAQVCNRLIAQRVPNFVAVFYLDLLALLLISPVVLMSKWQSVKGGDWFLVIIVGLISVIAQLILVKGYSYAPVAKLAPWLYLGPIFSVLIDWIVWERLPDIYFWFGALLIIGGGILTFKKKTT